LNSIAHDIMTYKSIYSDNLSYYNKNMVYSGQ